MSVLERRHKKLPPIIRADGEWLELVGAEKFADALNHRCLRVFDGLYPFANKKDDTHADLDAKDIVCSA